MDKETQKDYPKNPNTIKGVKMKGIKHNLRNLDEESKSSRKRTLSYFSTILLGSIVALISGLADSSIRVSFFKYYNLLDFAPLLLVPLISAILGSVLTQFMTRNLKIKKEEKIVKEELTQIIINRLNGSALNPKNQDHVSRP